MNGKAGGATAKLDAVGRILNGSVSMTQLTFKGWIGFEEDIEAFGYQIDNNAPIFGNFMISPEAAVRYEENGRAKAQRYAVNIPVSGLRGDHQIAVVVKVNGTVVRIDGDILMAETLPSTDTSLTYRR